MCVNNFKKRTGKKAGLLGRRKRKEEKKNSLFFFNYYFVFCLYSLIGWQPLFNLERF